MNKNQSAVDDYAKLIWDYMLMDHALLESDAVLAMGSIDERVAEFAAQLILDNYAPLLITSGGIAHQNDLLKTAWSESTEAEHFANIAKGLGVPSDKILLETEATNTELNITNTQKLIEEQQLDIRSIILVTKPYMERRVFATFKKQWRGEIGFSVLSPPISYDDYFNDSQPKDKVLNLMVGDLQRIREYPKRGFQIEQDMPDEVWQAAQQLIELGYDKHLIK